MTNTIEVIKTAIAEVEWEYPMEYSVAFEKAIESLERQEKYKWHNLREDPSDFPNDEEIVEVVFDVKNLALKYDVLTVGSCAWVEGMNPESNNPKILGWKYIEPFEEME